MRFQCEFWQRPPMVTKDGLRPKHVPNTALLQLEEIADILNIKSHMPYIPMYITIWFE